MKPVVRVIGAALPVLYCGYLLYYFLDLTGSVQKATDQGLGPTMVGLGAVGLVLSIPLIMKVVRMLAKLHTPGPPPDDDGVNPDAVIARYKARQDAAPPAPVSSHRSAAPAQRPSFGRKIR